MKYIAFKPIAIAAIVSLSTLTFAFSTDPVSSYLFNGSFVSPWKATVGNGLNWSIPVENQSATTERKNLTISSAEREKPGDALSLKWKGKKVKTEWGGNALYDSSFTISGHKVNLEPVKDAAAIVLQIKVIKAPNEQVYMSMRCNYSNKCEGKYPLKAVLRRLPKNEWTYLPIPLSCFNQDNSFEFKSVTTPISIATQGKLHIELANIGLTPLPEGSKGCAG